MAEKQGLTGAYYGPPIPPKRSSHRPGRGSGCGGPCCLLSCLFKIIISIAIVLGIIALVIWLVLRPARLKVHVEDATLTRFNLNNSNTLHYNLALNITIRNPNRRIGFDYDRVEARAFYEGERFGYTSLPDFYQGHKNTTTLSPAFNSQRVITLSSSDLNDFNRENTEGIFNIEVKIYSRIRLKIGSLKTHRFKPKFDCDLRVPLATDSTTNTGFSRTKCDIDY